MLRRRSSATSCADAAAVMYCKSKMCPTSIRGWRFFKRRSAAAVVGNSGYFQGGIRILRNQENQRITYQLKVNYLCMRITISYVKSYVL